MYYFFGNCLTHRVFRKFARPCVNWIDVVHEVNQVSVVDSDGISLFGFGGILHQTPNITRKPELQHMFNMLNSRYPLTAHVYYSMSRLSGSVNHCDDMNVLFWQQYGLTLWHIEKSKYVLWPGDALYIPRGVYHRVISVTPRIGISIGDDGTNTTV